jgi:hypothetical protein
MRATPAGGLALLGLTAGALLLPLVAAAVDLHDKGQLGSSVDQLGFPSLVRIVLGLLITLAIAAGIPFAIRRFWPALLERRSFTGAIRPLDRAPVSASLTVHLLEIDGVRMVIAEGSHGIEIAMLPPASREAIP